MHPIRAEAWCLRQEALRRVLLKYQPGNAAEIEAAFEACLAEGPPRVRRRSRNMAPPPVNRDVRARQQLIAKARALEDQSYAEAKAKARAEADATGQRARKVHRGKLGSVALELLEALLFKIPARDGCLFPSLATLARVIRKSVPTVVAAIARLVLAGFLTVHRRSKIIDTSMFGPREVQDSNCYEYHPPTGLGALGWSELKNQPGKEPKQNKPSKFNFRAILDAALKREPTGQGRLFDNYDQAMSYRRALKGVLR